MRNFSVIAVLVLLISTVQGFFIPLTTEQRVRAASVIAVIEIESFNHDQASVNAKVITGIFGAKAGEKFKVWEDVHVDKDGREWATNGRDPALEKGKRYFIYLTKNEKGRLVTVQSSLDSLDVSGDEVEKEDGEGVESLKLKIERIRKMVAVTTKSKKGGVGQVGDTQKSTPAAKKKLNTESDGCSL